ncbi:MAG: formylglycine-generating enzyme family protein [Deltaproteobacteria bacterium]|nr:formylglycine-generating enzyme family protein [Deltaproteobacteria bacterium]
MGEQCSAGRCIPSDGGASDASPGDLGGRDVIREAGADAALDAGRDAARDASVDAAAMPDAAMRDVALPDAAIVDAAIVDAAIADAAIADATTADTVQPDAAMPDAGQADAWLPPPPTWIPITGGTYEMGCSPNDTDCDSDESPRHSVTISAFEMTATEITQEQYQAVTGSNPSDHTGCPTCPVESVTWQNARDFCAAVGGRLPSEAEWEYAARAGTTTKYYCGDDAACLDGIAWYNDIETMWTHPVGQKTPNAFDLYDMLGNVYEWNADWYGWSYYASSPLQDPTGPATGTDRVLRGGSYPYSDRVLRASHRFGDTPDRKLNDIGFRCAR